MRGSVVKRGSKYAVVIDLGRDPATGKRRQKWHSGYSSERDAETALHELIVAVNRGTYVTPSRQTVAGFAEEWLAAIARTVRPATHYSYGRNLRLHVLPYIGDGTLAAVDGGTLNRLYSELLTDGHRAGGSGLSPRSVRYVHTIVHRMFKDAVRWGRLTRNPADAADPPKAGGAAAKLSTWTPAQLRQFLSWIDGDRLAAAFLLLATTGMRRGEALGLRWADINLDAGTASIRQTVIAVRHRTEFGEPKTASGRRAVALDPATVAALRRHRTAQKAERLKMGDGWTDHGLVFCKVDGSPLHPERFSRYFDRRVQQSGLPRIRLHDLRHGWATIALASGVHPKVVQERLGHASVSITLSVYSHVSPGMHAEAASRVAGVIFGEAARGR